MTAGARWRFALVVAATAAVLAPYGVERARDTTPDVEGTGLPSLTVQGPAEGAVVAGNVVELALEVSAIPPAARYAVFVDRNPPASGAAIPYERGVVLSDGPVIPVGGLSPGPHRFTVVLADATRARLGELAASVRVRTTGPSLTASAQLTAVEGDPWTITVTLQGIAITNGADHLHFLIDQDLPPPGVPISLDAENIVHTTETKVPIIGLAAGEHRVWIVAGDAEHRPLVPYAADEVFVRVSR